jgi:hypothetical protein
MQFSWMISDMKIESSFMFCWPCISIYACNETNLKHYLSSVYSVTIPVHVSGLLVAHHEEVTMYICDKWYVLYWKEIKGKGTPVTDPKAKRGGRGIALLFPDLGTRRGWVVSITPRPPYPRERPSTHCTGGWVGPRAGLDVCKKSLLPPGFNIPGLSSPEPVAIPTELSQPDRKEACLKLLEYQHVIIKCETYSCYVNLLKGIGKLSTIIHKYLDTYTI